MQDSADSREGSAAEIRRDLVQALLGLNTTDDVMHAALQALQGCFPAAAVRLSYGSAGLPFPSEHSAPGEGSCGDFETDSCMTRVLSERSCCASEGNISWIGACLYAAGAVPFGGIVIARAAAFDSRDVALLSDIADLISLMLAPIESRRAFEQGLLDADRRKDEFIAMLAHELRNPLATISAGVELLQRPRPEEKAAMIRTTIRERTIQLARLIDDLLDVSRITRGKIALNKEHSELSPIIERAVSAVRDMIEDRGHSFVLDIPQEHAHIFGDVMRLEQIFVNLLSNAAKYTPAGGEIRLSSGIEAESVVVRVKDSGVGIAEDAQSRIFDMFSRMGESVHRPQGGMGVGLTIVKRLVEMHGGSVGVHSEGVGRGSEFEVRLPLVHRAPKRSVAEVQASPPASRPLRILVVEDHPDTALMTAALLEEFGHKIEIAHDGFAGLELSKKHRPEVILLDIGLPGLDGYEVARRLRKEQEFHDTLILAVTGYGQKRDRERSEAAGFNAHIIKPVDYEALVSIIDKWQSDRVLNSKSR